MEFFRFDRSMNNQRLHRTNSFIRDRKERAGLSLKKQEVIYLKAFAKNQQNI